MAPYTKEAIIILLDTGENTLISSGKDGKSFFDRAKACVSKIIQRKIFSKPHDEIGLLLMGSEYTKNDLNDSQLVFEHFDEMMNLEVPNWQMLRVIDGLQPSDYSSDWVDGLIVALNFARNETMGKKFGNIHIIMLTNFITQSNDSHMDVIIESAKEMNVRLTAISDNVEHINELDETQFSQNPLKSQNQTSSEKLFAQVIEKIPGNLCHIDHAEAQLLHFEKAKSRSMPWNAQLCIGSELKINISAYVKVQEEKFLSSFKTESTVPNTLTKMVTEYTQNNQAVEKPDVDNVIKAYQYGDKLVVIPDELDDYKIKEMKKCFDCLGFTKRELISKEILAGSGSHVVLPQKGFSKSSNLFHVLVDMLIKSDRVMVVRKIYRDNAKPTIVALFPNYDDNIPYFTMIQLPCYEEICLLSFPSLNSKKTEPSQEQLEAVEKLINSMDLMNAVDDDSGFNEAFAIERTINPSHQHLCRSVAFRALNPSQPLPAISDELMKMISIPDKIKKESEEIINQLKTLFPVEIVEVTKKSFGQSGSSQEMDVDNEDDVACDGKDDKKNIVAVGTVSPAEDFAWLLKKGERFSDLCKQIESVIFDLIFRTATMAEDKVKETIMMYREQGKIYGPFQYNSWIKEFKEVLMLRNRQDVFKDVITTEGLGLITNDEAVISTVSVTQQLEFYEVNSKQTKDVEFADMDDDDADLEALL